MSDDTMTSQNIFERRAYVFRLIEQGCSFSTQEVKQIAKEWNSSPSAIYSDISAYAGEVRYCKTPVKSQNFRAARLGAPGLLLEHEWSELREKYGNKCLACAATSDLVIDHIVPLSKGGNNTIGNVQLLCRACNARKSNKVIDYR